MPVYPTLSGINSIKGKTGKSGQDYYNLYIALLNDPSGWWWDVWGKDFSVYDFLSMAIYYDAGSQIANPNLGEAAVRAANGFCTTMYNHVCTIGEYFNQFAQYYQAGANNMFSKFPPQIATPPDINALRQTSSELAQHDSAWNEGCSSSGWSRPCGWGNLSLYSPDEQQVLLANPQAMFAYVTGGDPWIMPSGCVYYQWEHGGPDSYYNLSLSCPSVQAH